MIASASLAHAMLINELHFDGTPGAGSHGYSNDLTGKDPITWSVQNSNETAYLFAASSPLTFGNLLTTPTYVSGGGSFLRSTFSFPANASTTWGDLGMVGSVSTHQVVSRGSIWSSALIRTDSSSANMRYAIGGRNTITSVTHAASNLAISALPNQDFTVTYKSGATAHGTEILTGFNNVIGETNFVVMNIDYGDGTENITYKLWLNPTPGVTDPGTPDFTATVAWSAMEGTDGRNVGIASAYFQPGSGADQGSIDSIRVGTTYLSVAPVPEPSTYAVFLGLAVMGLVLGIRRRSRAR